MRKSSSLTDGARRRLMMPPAKTVGTNVNCTPKGLNSVVMIGTPPAPLDCAVGTGNSPPARKEAVSPESATKSGSARRRMRPLVSSAVRVTSRLPFRDWPARRQKARSSTRDRREQSPYSIEYRKARCPAASGRTGCGYRVSARVVQPVEPSRSAPRGRRAQAGREASVPRVVCPKPINPDFAARGAGDLKKSDPEHHLLRRRDRHGIHDVAFGHHGLGYLYSALGGHRIAGEAADHDLAVAAANADAAAAGAGLDILLQIAGIDRRPRHRGCRSASSNYRTG